ncbi:ama1 protein [Strigomonas culicis]|uniref:Ama1 protein n=1 Tax=Strigomonas culicis TaxID=28005 RepID=S9TM60_9TRYP|nr:ama1 protein [Strigomonas culicis]|eukprot:EPY17443.1 ama1 protein [Strigomonas culicis]
MMQTNDYASTQDIIVSIAPDATHGSAGNRTNTTNSSNVVNNPTCRQFSHSAVAQRHSAYGYDADRAGIVDGQQAQSTDNTTNAVHGGAASSTSIPLSGSRNGRRPFHYGLWVCCHDCSSFLEGNLCCYCQMTRQGCYLMHNKRGHFNVFFCCGLFCIDFALGCFPFSFVYVVQLRQILRDRYQIAGSGIGDCCVSACCRCCAVQQMLLEMTIMDEFPGAFCYEKPSEVPVEVEIR